MNSLLGNRNRSASFTQVSTLKDGRTEQPEIRQSTKLKGAKVSDKRGDLKLFAAKGKKLVCAWR